MDGVLLNGNSINIFVSQPQLFFFQLRTVRLPDFQIFPQGPPCSGWGPIIHPFNGNSTKIYLVHSGHAHDHNAFAGFFSATKALKYFSSSLGPCPLKSYYIIISNYLDHSELSLRFRKRSNPILFCFHSTIYRTCDIKVQNLQKNAPNYVQT